MSSVRSVSSVTVVLASLVSLGAFACGGGEERRPAREPRSKPVAVSTTRTTSAALTTKTTSASVAPQSGNDAASTNATMTPGATPVVMAPPPRPKVDTAGAVMQMMTARCDHEEACRNVGTGKEFGDRDACFNEVGHDIVQAIPSDECSSGVDSERLAACVAELKTGACVEGGAGVLERAPSCSREQLCVRSF